MDRVHLARLPTPLHRLERLSGRCGADLWAKRDDMTGFAMGGNKVRKAEYLLADAVARGATLILTAGAVQSNHARVIAAASAVCGIRCRLVLSGAPEASPSRNLFLDELAGADVDYVESGGDRGPRMQTLADEEAARGGTPYIVPVGGSNGVGALGYIQCWRELVEQLASLPPKRTSVVFATSSGGTYGGLLAGALADAGETADVGLAGIRVDDDPGAEEAILDVAAQALRVLGNPSTPVRADLNLVTGFCGPGYGIPSDEGRAAQAATWRHEGVLLDLSYTAKAMAGLLGLAASGEFADTRVVFVHTGGEPAAMQASA